MRLSFASRPVCAPIVTVSVVVQTMVVAALAAESNKPTSTRRTMDDNMPSIHVASRRRKPPSLHREFGGDAALLDVTSRGPDLGVQFAPFHPHGGVPIPMSGDRTAQAVEGIWQALKVFETCSIDESKFDVTTMNGLKRIVRRFGRVLGHQAGLDGDELLPYVEARRKIQAAWACGVVMLGLKRSGGAAMVPSVTPISMRCPIACIW